MTDKAQSNWVLHQSGSGEEYRDDEKEYEGELENEVTEGNVRAEVNIAQFGIYAKDDTWVHPYTPLLRRDRTRSIGLISLI